MSKNIDTPQYWFEAVDEPQNAPASNDQYDLKTMKPAGESGTTPQLTQVMPVVEPAHGAHSPRETPCRGSTTEARATGSLAVDSWPTPTQADPETKRETLD